MSTTVSRRAIVGLTLALLFVAGLLTWSVITNVRNESEARRTAFWMKFLV